jgi:hypothetical protein
MKPKNTLLLTLLLALGFASCMKKSCFTCDSYLEGYPLKVPEKISSEIICDATAEYIRHFEEESINRYTITTDNGDFEVIKRSYCWRNGD